MQLKISKKVHDKIGKNSKSPCDLVHCSRYIGFLLMFSTMNVDIDDGNVPGERQLEVHLEFVEEVRDAGELSEAHLARLRRAECDDAGRLFALLSTSAPLLQRHGVVLGVVQGRPRLQQKQRVNYINLNKNCYNQVETIDNNTHFFKFFYESLSLT